MMLIHITLVYTTFALAYPSSTNPIWQNSPVFGLQSEEGKAIQIPNQGLCHAGIGLSTKHLEALDAIRSKAFPSPVENISSLLLSYAKAGAEKRWNTTVKHTKALLDSLTEIAIQHDTLVPGSDSKTQLQNLSTKFLDLLPLSIPTQHQSGVTEISSTSLNAPPNPTNGTLSPAAMQFLTMHATSLSLIPVLSLITLSMIQSTPPSPNYNAEVTKYKTELELLRTSFLKTSKPVPFSGDQCRTGVPSILEELKRNPSATISYMGAATLYGLMLTVAGVLSGMIIMAYDAGIDNAFRMTHTAIREWAALMNGDASSCKNFPPPMNEGVHLRWVDVAKVKDEVARDPGMFISDALSFASGFDVMRVMQHAEKASDTTGSSPSRWMEFIVGLPGALDLEYKQGGHDAFVEMITPKVRKSIQMNCSPRDMQ
jgi:hypothetical protein